MKFFNLALIAATAAALRIREGGSDATMPDTQMPATQKDPNMHQCWEEEEKREDWKPQANPNFDSCYDSFFAEVWRLTDHNQDMKLQRCEFESLLWTLVNDWGMPMHEMDGALEWYEKEMNS